jgi:hypothetical protein
VERHIIGAENSPLCCAASASRTNYDARMERDCLYQISPSPSLSYCFSLFCPTFIVTVRTSSGFGMGLCRCPFVYVLIIMFETLVASDSHISASSRSVPLSLSFCFIVTTRWKSSAGGREHGHEHSEPCLRNDNFWQSGGGCNNLGTYK